MASYVHCSFNDEFLSYDTSMKNKLLIKEITTIAKYDICYQLL